MGSNPELEKYIDDCTDHNKRWIIGHLCITSRWKSWRTGSPPSHRSQRKWMCRKARAFSLHTWYYFVFNFSEWWRPYNPFLHALIHNVILMIWVVTHTTHNSRMRYNFLAKNALDAIAAELMTRLIMGENRKFIPPVLCICDLFLCVKYAMKVYK